MSSRHWLRKGSIYGVCHGRMSLRGGVASPRQHGEHSHEHQDESRWLGDRSIRGGARATAGAAAKVGPPRVEASLRAEVLAPDDIVAGIHYAVVVVVA